MGRIIRKARINELPPLLNVLRGEMDIIGPRRVRPTIIDQLKRDARSYELRYCVQPGQTG